MTERMHVLNVGLIGCGGIALRAHAPALQRLASLVHVVKVCDVRPDAARRLASMLESEWTPGSRYRGVSPFAAAPIWEGENVEVDPPRRLVQTFRALWSDNVKREGTSTVTWDIEPIGDSCRLVVTHSDLREDANPELHGGWMMILSGLKTLLETGQLLTTPGSLRYAQGPQPAA